MLADWDFAVNDEFDQAIWAIYPPKRIVPPKVRAFIDFMAEQIGQ